MQGKDFSDNFRKYCILTEDSKRLRKDLDVIKKEYDGHKHNIVFENNKNKAKIRTLNRKEKIVKTKLLTI